MNGTVVELNTHKTVTAFHVSHDVGDERRYKTVNICSLSSQSWQRVIACLDRYVEDGRVGEYYETVFADMVADTSLEFDAVFFDENKWYEIDAMKDLHQAFSILPVAPKVAPSGVRLLKDVFTPGWTKIQEKASSYAGSRMVLDVVG